MLQRAALLLISTFAFSASFSPPASLSQLPGSAAQTGLRASSHSCRMPMRPDAHIDAADLAKAAAIISGARRLVVFTGAGMSADSGIATFRKSANSLWAGIRGTLGLAYFGTPIGWKLTPGLAWRLYLSEFFAPIAAAEPHAGYAALARLEEARFSSHDCTVVTMNVDSLHRQAGSANVVQVHGTVDRVFCTRCSTRRDLPHDLGGDVSALKRWRCLHCGGRLRPDVVLFTESLPAEQWRAATSACGSLTAQDCLLVVGTSGGVYPAAGLPEAAIAAGVPVVEINMDPSPISSQIACYIRGRAAAVLPQLVDAVLAYH